MDLQLPKNPNNSPTPLLGVRVVLFALNLPGPAAAARLHALGASVIKIEPITGDPFERLSPAWYHHLRDGMDVRRVDLRQAPSREMLEDLLRDADVFITSFRRASLERLLLDPVSVAKRFPRLCQVAITGFAGAQQSVAGHDLTYQAAAGLLDPKSMPRTLIADLGGVERAVSSTMMLLFARAQGRTELHVEVSLAEVAHDFAMPVRMKNTTSDGLLGGANPFYRIYETRDGFVALAALESQFQRSMYTNLQNLAFSELFESGLRLHALPRPDAHAMSVHSRQMIDQLQRVFRERSANEWERWGAEHDVPIAALVGAGLERSSRD